MDEKKFYKAMSEIRCNRNFLDNIEIARSEYEALEAEIERTRWHYPERGEYPVKPNNYGILSPFLVVGQYENKYTGFTATCICAQIGNSNEFMMDDGLQKLTRWRYVD